MSVVDNVTFDGRLFNASGHHILADLHGITADKLASSDDLERVMTQAAEVAGATVLSSHFHHFGDKQGVTGVVLLAESHMSIHTWPEAGFAAVDIFMCGSTLPQRALDFIALALAAAQCTSQTVARGLSGPQIPIS